jgi:radical SAM superfamily enzyme YgiQ (UPF0313 family)
MKVTLIIPPSPFLLDERVFPSLGLLKIAAVLKQKNYIPDVLDLSGIKNYLDVLEVYLNSTSDSNVFCITATTPQLPHAVKIKDVIKKHKVNSRVVLGGPHVTLIYSAFKSNPNTRSTKNKEALEYHFDCLVSGDGEKAIFPAVETNLKFIDGDDPKQPYFLTNDDYEKLPLPSRDLIDLKSYHYSIDKKPATSLIAQLGCPFNCGFCGGRLSNSLRRIRTRSGSNILNEIEYLHKEYGYEGFMFYDDELNVNKQFEDLLKDLIDLQKRLKTDFRFRGFVKSELFTDKQAELMYQAGFRWILCGFEAGNDRILLNINKKATYDDNCRVIEKCKKHGLKIKSLMSVGHPGESEQTISDVANFLINNGTDDFDCTIITPYPGTPYYDKSVEVGNDIYKYTVEKTGDVLYSKSIDYSLVSNFYKGVPGQNYESYVYTDHLNATQLVQLRDDLEDKVRKTLNIPFNQSTAALLYEHSMGQSLPNFILKN